MNSQHQSSCLKINATRIIASTFGVFFGFSGINHGFLEFLQGSVPANGLIMQAIGVNQ